MEVCCQYLPLGLLGGCTTPSVPVGTLFKNFAPFLTCLILLSFAYTVMYRLASAFRTNYSAKSVWLYQLFLLSFGLGLPALLRSQLPVSLNFAYQPLMFLTSSGSRSITRFWTFEPPYLVTLFMIPQNTLGVLFHRCHFGTGDCRTTFNRKKKTLKELT